MSEKQKRIRRMEIGNEFSALAIFAFVLELLNAGFIWLVEATEFEFAGVFYPFFGIAFLAALLLSATAMILRLITWSEREDGDPKSGTARTIFAGVILLLNLALVIAFIVALLTPDWEHYHVYRE